MKRTPIKRDPEAVQAWQRRSAKKAQAKAAAQPKKRSRATARKPIAKVNRKRRARLRIEKFGTPEQVREINSMPCVCTLAPRRHPECTGGFSEPSHVVSRGAGGKADAIVPQSSGCHRALHAHGIVTYCESIGWTVERLRDEATRTHERVIGIRERGDAYGDACKNPSLSIPAQSSSRQAPKRTSPSSRARIAGTRGRSSARPACCGSSTTCCTCSAGRS